MVVRHDSDSSQSELIVVRIDRIYRTYRLCRIYRIYRYTYTYMIRYVSKSAVRVSSVSYELLGVRGGKAPHFKGCDNRSRNHIVLPPHSSTTQVRSLPERKWLGTIWPPHACAYICAHAWSWCSLTCRIASHAITTLHYCPFSVKHTQIPPLSSSTLSLCHPLCHSVTHHHMYIVTQLFVLLDLGYVVPYPDGNVGRTPLYVQVPNEDTYVYVYRNREAKSKQHGCNGSVESVCYV